MEGKQAKRLCKLSQTPESDAQNLVQTFVQTHSQYLDKRYI